MNLIDGSIDECKHDISSIPAIIGSIETLKHAVERRTGSMIDTTLYDLLI